MNDRYCPCGTRLDRTSAIRPLKSPCLRMFMSIRTMKSLTIDTKICNPCRMEFIKWKKENSEFEMILNRVESDMADGNSFDNNSVNSFAFFHLNILIFFLFKRVMVWTCKLIRVFLLLNQWQLMRARIK